MKKLLFIPIVGGAVVGAYLYGQATSIAAPITRVVEKTIQVVGPPPEKIEVSRQAMLRALEGKLELTTASMRLEKYVPGGVCNGNAWQNFAYENCVTMLVPAKINAGFDWGTWKPEQITATHERVTIDLGAPKIFDVVIDHKNIKVLYQGDGAFVSPDKTLQTRVLAASEPAFRRDACNNDILHTASLEAEKRVSDIERSLLHTAGDTREVVVTSKAPLPC
jgi:Protein of unknown function (DUF4230)